MHPVTGVDQPDHYVGIWDRLPELYDDRPVYQMQSAGEKYIKWSNLHTKWIMSANRSESVDHIHAINNVSLEPGTRTVYEKKVGK